MLTGSHVLAVPYEGLLHIVTVLVCAFAAINEISSTPKIIKIFFIFPHSLNSTIG